MALKALMGRMNESTKRAAQKKPTGRKSPTQRFAPAVSLEPTVAYQAERVSLRSTWKLAHSQHKYSYTPRRKDRGNMLEIGYRRETGEHEAARGVDPRVFPTAEEPRNSVLACDSVGHQRGTTTLGS